MYSYNSELISQLFAKQKNKPLQEQSYMYGSGGQVRRWVQGEREACVRPAQQGKAPPLHYLAN